MATVHVDGESLKEGLLGLVLALVEIIAEVLRGQAVRRLEGGGLDPAEAEAVGAALLKLDAALAEIKEELGVMASVESVRRSLDDVVAEALEVATVPWSTSTRP